jgi:hypothetical protein
LSHARRRRPVFWFPNEQLYEIILEVVWERRPAKLSDGLAPSLSCRACRWLTGEQLVGNDAGRKDVDLISLASPDEALTVVGEVSDFRGHVAPAASERQVDGRRKQV